ALPPSLTPNPSPPRGEGLGVRGWDGGPLQGRTILLHAEQGLGDTLQFIRYAPLVKAKGGHVVVQCQGSLIPLLSRCAGVDSLVPWGAKPPPFDVYAALLSLPALLGTTLSNIPNEVPYLHADPALVEHWRRQLAIVPGFKVGVAWQGSIRHAWDRHRSVPLSSFAPLAAVPGVRLISLQKGPGSEQAQGPLPFPIADFGDLVDRTGGAFMDTAAILPHLDLVISVDTAVAHLAGALGAPVWLALHHTPDWRWLLNRSDSPWYPSARLFRQPAPGEWAPVFREIAKALNERALASGRRKPADEPPRLLVPVSAGELLDKISILRIKEERIGDPEKRRHVQDELAALESARQTVVQAARLQEDAGGPPAPPLAELEAELAAVNARLWDVEDALRVCERNQDFGPRFIALARSVYQTNDRRAAAKRAINDLLGSPLVEVKSYGGQTASR
ncbi:MAG TPA: hypothetical protein VMS17_32735, partial [Gemmataceae bacterium]|nr:hypothetical protein [Gemmataceae bacterium]